MSYDQNHRRSPIIPRMHRRPNWLMPVLIVVAYGCGLVAAHLVKPWLPELTLWSYVVAEAGGLAFLLRYVRTDWRHHPWGRHVMAFMVCLEILFTLAVSRRVLGDFPGLEEMVFLASATFAGIVWWRERLQARGDIQSLARARADDAAARSETTNLAARQTTLPNPPS